MKYLFITIPLVLLITLSCTSRQATPLDQMENPSIAGIPLIYVEPGSYKMSSDGRLGSTHEVTISNGFWMSKYEITKEQWMDIMVYDPTPEWLSPNLPVSNISWEECQIFMERMTETYGYNCSLPSEAQWEYAYRSGSDRRYYWGNAINEDFLWYAENSGTIQEVGQKYPNHWGFYDIAGNVQELCLDWDSKLTESPTSDPMGPDSGSYRVTRGGSWQDNADSQSSFRIFRGTIENDEGRPNIGFRLVVNENPTDSE